MPAFLSLLLTACTAGQHHETPDALSLFLGKLKELAGPDATECGIVSLSNDTSPAIACAAAAQSAGKSFWFALELQGIDSAIWTGGARNDGGLTYRANFDSDVHGGSQSVEKPAVGVWTCSALTFEAGSDPEHPFKCENWKKVAL